MFSRNCFVALIVPYCVFSTGLTALSPIITRHFSVFEHVYGHGSSAICFVVVVLVVFVVVIVTVVVVVGVVVVVVWVVVIVWIVVVVEVVVVV